MTHAFDEGFQSDKRDPLDAQQQDFDWLGLYARLAEDAGEGANDKLLAETVTRLLQVIIPLRAHYLSPLSVGLNVIALAWVISPQYFDGSPSMSQLARRCGVPPRTLARHTAYYSRLLRWRNRAQRHAWNFKMDPAEPAKKGQPASGHEAASQAE
jgi:hypothetical protein